MKALIATAHCFEESELLVPYYRLQEEGLEVDVAALRRGAVLGKHAYQVRAAFMRAALGLLRARASDAAELAAAAV